MVEQRVCNRIIEYLDLAASYEEQTVHENAGPPFVNVPYEIINQWGDWIVKDPRRDPRPLEVFSTDEVLAMCEFQSRLDLTVRAVSNDYPQTVEVQALPE